MVEQRGLSRLLSEGVTAHAWPCAVLGVTTAEQVLFCEVAGRHMYESGRSACCGDVFDIASLTKVVGTTTAVMQLCECGVLDLDRPVVATLPAFASAVRGRESESWRRSVTLRHLLAHASGLPAYVPFHREHPGSRQPLDVVLRTGLLAAPGSRECYSDIGMMVVGLMVEVVTDTPLARYLCDSVFAPLGMGDTGYCPTGERASRAVPTEVQGGSDTPLRGIVHDENARWAGGVAGHAGLFSTVPDLLRFARTLLNGGRLGGVSLVSPVLLGEFTRPAGFVAGSSRCLGWDSPSAGSSGGCHLSRTSFGHTGFTGTSLWIDPRNGIGTVLLSNAVHPHRDCRKRAFFDWRRRVHSAVYELLRLV